MSAPFRKGDEAVIAVLSMGGWALRSERCRVLRAGAKIVDAEDEHGRRHRFNALTGHCTSGNGGKLFSRAAYDELGERADLRAGLRRAADEAPIEALRAAMAALEASR